MKTERPISAITRPLASLEPTEDACYIDPGVVGAVPKKTPHLPSVVRAVSADSTGDNV